MRRWAGVLSFGALCAAATHALSSSSGAHPERPAAPVSGAVAAARGGGPRVRVSADFAQRFGVATTRLTSRSLAPALDLVGSVDFDADRVADIGARIRGRVTRILASTGAEVVVGTPLVELESASLGDVLAARATAHAGAAAARARLERETALFRDRLTTARAVEEAQADLARYEAEDRGAAHRLAAMGAGSGDGRRVILRAPIAGRVIRRQAIVGQMIDDTSVVMRVADLRHVWVQLDAYERDLPRIQVGDRVEVQAEGSTAPTIVGAVRYVDATIDLRTRTARVRVEVENPDLALRPGQFVSARVRTAAAGQREVMTIPRSAVVQLEGRPAAFVVRGPQEYEACTLTLGAADGADVEVERGLLAGDEVVTAGAFVLKSELMR